jgi:hypothetical protein
MLAITAPKLQQLYDYWLARRGRRAFPARADIDPIELRFIIGNLVLVDVIDDDPKRFRIRLHGTNLVQRARYELTGKMIDALPVSEYRAQARESFTEVATSGEPLHRYRDRIFDGRRHCYETLILPLSQDGVRVNMLLVGLLYDDERGVPLGATPPL